MVINFTCKMIGQYHIRSTLQPSERNVKYRCDGAWWGGGHRHRDGCAVGEKCKLQTVDRLALERPTPHCPLAKVMKPTELIARCQKGDAFLQTVKPREG